MANLKRVEEKIFKTEGFRVVFTKNGKDVRGDTTNIPQYSYEKAASDTWTVSEWKVKRFSQSYPGFEVLVFDFEDKIAAGNKTLATIRGNKK